LSNAWKQYHLSLLLMNLRMVKGYLRHHPRLAFSSDGRECAPGPAVARCV
jgi:hypothetical protein